MDLVTRAVGSIIDKLGPLLQAAYMLQKGLPEQIESLKKELESAHTVLRDVREVPREQLDPQVRLWAREVREASYDMEDILDTFHVNAVDLAAPADESKDGLLGRLKEKTAKLFNEIKARHTIAGQIEEMKKRLQQVADRRDRYSVVVAPPGPATRVDPRLVDMHKEAAQLIGIDKTRAQLIDKLRLPSRGQGDAAVISGAPAAPSGCCSTESKRVNKGGGGEGRGKRRRKAVRGEEQEDVQLGPPIAAVSGSSNKMKIVSVVGAGGLGKTTLAKAVYDQLRQQYDCGAFVSVGRKPDLVKSSPLHQHLLPSRQKRVRGHS